MGKKQASSVAARRKRGLTRSGFATIVLGLFLMNPAGAQGGSPDNYPGGISMTMYHVVKGPNGQEFYLNQNKQTIPLPGAGVTTKGVCIYSAPDGSQWYVDSTGTRQTLPPGYGAGYQPQFNSSGYPPAQNNYYYNQQSQPQSSAGGLNLNIGGIPTGVPMYWGSSGPYYSSAGGSPVYVNRDVSNVHQFSEFNQESNNFSRTNTNWNHNNNFNHNNWDNHWGQNSWPGKDHGFPPPHDQVPGRLYANNPTEGGGFVRRDGGGGGFEAGGFEHHEGGGGFEHHDGSGGFEHHDEGGGGVFGGLGGGRFGAGGRGDGGRGDGGRGDGGRGDGGGERHGDGGERHGDGGGERHGDGGGERHGDGGGERHGDGGGERHGDGGGERHGDGGERHGDGGGERHGGGRGRR